MYAMKTENEARRSETVSQTGDRLLSNADEAISVSRNCFARASLMKVGGGLKNHDWIQVGATYLTPRIYLR